MLVLRLPYIHIEVVGHSRHEALDRAEDLWVADELRQHVGVVIHHLPANDGVSFKFSFQPLTDCTDR